MSSVESTKDAAVELKKRVDEQQKALLEQKKVIEKLLADAKKGEVAERAQRLAKELQDSLNGLRKVSGAVDITKLAVFSRSTRFAHF